MMEREIGPFWVLEQIGQGAWGTAFKGVHKTRDQEVVILQFPVDAFPDAAESFVRDATFLKRAAPRRIPRIHLCRRDEGNVFLVTEYLTVTLEDQLRKDGPLPEATAVHLCRALLETLQYLHRYRIVHGHISPGMILLAPDGALKLGYFGTGTLQGGAAPDIYRPPEESGGTAATPASDVYALGATLCRMLGAEPPFSAVSTCSRGREISPALRALLAKAVANDPRQRFATAGEFAASLRKVAESPPSDSPGARLAAMLRYKREAMGVVLLGLILLFFIIVVARQGGKVALKEREQVPPRPPVGTELPPASEPLGPSNPAPPKTVQTSAQGEAAPAPPVAAKKKHHPAHKKKSRRRWHPEGKEMASQQSGPGRSEKGTPGTSGKETGSLPAPGARETASLSRRPAEPPQSNEVEPWTIRK